MRREQFYPRATLAGPLASWRPWPAIARRRQRSLALLDGQYGDEDPALMNWLRPCFVDLAGEMQLEEAVPLLMDYVGDEADDNMADSAATALQRIGGDVVVREIDARWWHC